jgi:hypothetical protein
LFTTFFEEVAFGWQKAVEEKVTGIVHMSALA